MAVMMVVRWLIGVGDGLGFVFTGQGDCLF